MQRCTVSIMGLARPASYLAMADCDVPARLATSACDNPDRSLASRITAPSVVVATPYDT